MPCPRKKRIAIGESQKAAELSQNDSDALAALAYTLVLSGKRAEALKILREWQRQSQISDISPNMIATAYAGTGEKDKAFAPLARGQGTRRRTD